MQLEQALTGGFIGTYGCTRRCGSAVLAAAFRASGSDSSASLHFGSVLTMAFAIGHVSVSSHQLFP